ncbi:ubiquitin-specific protease OTU1 [Aspergillus undulatus]|uniref:ubiquitin-specific protease OTU1 n=1 Tax=Aspergillus undulatus TaxID=1810928 RepID=UPI003CCC908C
MRLRIRGPSGQFTVALSEKATVGDLRNEIVEKTGLSAYDVKLGYPPQPLSFDHAETHQRLTELGVQLDREQLIIIPKDGPVAEPAAQTQDASASTARPLSPKLSLSRKQNPVAEDTPKVPSLEHGGIIVLRVMPDDNSCLFRAISTAVLPGSDSMVELRSAVAETIQSNPDEYSSAILGQPRDDYCRWIRTETSWGGAIEMNILSKHFDIEICSIDLSNLRVDHFNEGQDRRCFLVYSGIHYDTIALSPGDDISPEFDTTVFDSSDDLVLEKAKVLCRQLQEKNYYTDVAAFSLQCNICNSILTGQKGAQEHTSRTGHSDFEQVA